MGKAKMTDGGEGRGCRGPLEVASGAEAPLEVCGDGGTRRAGQEEADKFQFPSDRAVILPQLPLPCGNAGSGKISKFQEGPHILYFL